MVTGVQFASKYFLWCLTEETRNGLKQAKGE